MKGVVLLLLAVIGANAAPSEEDCQGLAERVPTKDLHKIHGDWVLVWSVSNHTMGDSLLVNVSSSHVEFKLLPDNKTIEYIERNVYLENLKSCTVYYTNMTVPSDDKEFHTLPSDSIRVETDGVVQEYNDTGDVDFYKTCPDCLMMTYKTGTHAYLLIYKREGQHRDVEQMKTSHPEFEKVAECLFMPHEKIYIYDGVADFCHRKSAPETSA